MSRAPALAAAAPLAAAALLAAACHPAPVADPATAARLTTIEQRLAAIEAATAHAAPGHGAAAPALPEERLQRVETRLDKIVAFLQQAVPPTLDTSVTYAVPIDPADPVLGPADAKVTVVEAFEFLCPYCAMIAPEVDKLRAAHPKDVRVVYKYFLIHGPPAIPAGQGACAAAKQGAARYAAYQQAVWGAVWPAGAQGADRERATADAIAQVAKGAGLDAARFAKDVAGADCQAWIDRSGQVLQRFGAGGTPSFYVNGRSVQSDELEAAVVEAAAAVDRSGVAPARFYQDVILKTGAAEAHTTSPFE